MLRRYRFLWAVQPEAAITFLAFVWTGGNGLPSSFQPSNKSQWTGNYLLAGVTTVELDIRVSINFFGPPSFPIRIAIKESDPSTDGYCSATPIMLSTDNLWHHLSFSLEPQSLTRSVHRCRMTSTFPMSSILESLIISLRRFR